MLVMIVRNLIHCSVII